MKKLLLFFTSLFVSLLTTSCGGPAGDGAATAPGVTDSTIVVGTWGPLTGPAALWGSIPKGMDAYFRMINEEGGINGRQIRLIMKDDAYDPSRTVPAVREMVQKDEVYAFVGGIGTAPGLAVMDYINENRIPWISPISGSSAWAYPPKDNIFSVFPLYFDEAEVQAGYAVDSMKAGKIAIIYQNDDFGKSGLVSARHALEGKGMTLAAEVSVEVTDTDLSSHAARLKEAGADVVLLWTAPRQAAIILGTTLAMGYKPQWVTGTILSDMTLMHDITKGAWAGVVSAYFGELPLPSDTTNALLSKYRAAYARAYPDERWGVFPLAGFFYAEPFVEAVRRAGDDLSRENLIRTLENMTDYRTLDGTGPTISFGPGLRQGLRECYLFRCLGAQDAEAVTPTIRATSDPNVLISRLNEN